MGQFRLLLSTAIACVLTACGGSSHFNAGIDENHSAAAGSRDAGAILASKKTEAAAANAETHTNAASPAEKLIALTFDDGPRPYVLFGSKGVRPAPGLVDILDQNGIKATFFVVGWRLTPKTWGEPRHEENIGVTCLDAAEQLIRRGHELEDHTYSHLELRSAEKRNGEQWVISDVNRGAQAIKAVTGTQPRFFRPPDWIITNDARRDLEHQGYRVLTISTENTMALRDVNSLDYLCGGKAVGCPKPSLVNGVLKQIEQREKKGAYNHILAFHELSTTTAAMPQLIAELKARGYRFVTLTEYISQIESKVPFRAAAKPGESGKEQVRAAHHPDVAR
jgi:peptidoglycan/xylan/chitin deacetylase (PgdA/CDA1 family)